LQGARPGVAATAGGGDAGRESARPRDEGETAGPEAGHRLPGGAGEADGLRTAADGRSGDRHGRGGGGGAVRGGRASGQQRDAVDRGSCGGGVATTVYRGQRRLGG